MRSRDVMELSRKDAQHHLNRQITDWIDKALRKDLEAYDPGDTFDKMTKVLRSIEEFINIFKWGISDNERIELGGIQTTTWNNDSSYTIDQILKGKYNEEVIERYKKIVLETSRMLIEFSFTGDHLGYSSVKEAVDFYQSRRRHFVNTLYVVPAYCKGYEKPTDEDVLRILVNISDGCLINVTALYQQLVLSHIYHDYVLTVHTNDSVTGNYSFNILEEFFTEAERVSIDDPIMREVIQSIDHEPMPVRKVFSVAELRNSCALIKSYCNFFTHKDPILFSLVNVIENLTFSFISQDYFIDVSEIAFVEALKSYDAKNWKILLNILSLSSEDFIVCANSHHPFVRVDNYFKSNVNLCLRFLYNYKNKSLNQNKRYQIKAGFFFEQNVKRKLLELGFEVLEVKRIQKQEFDVVATYGGSLFNFQCKNNFLDITQMEIDPEGYSKKNQSVVQYYLRALQKEVRRERLLIEKYGVQDVRHFVISRFPVFTKELAIIQFKDLGTLFQLIHRSSK